MRSSKNETATLTTNVLAMVEHEHAHHVIFDITGVPLVDTHVAQVLAYRRSFDDHLHTSPGTIRDMLFYTLIKHSNNHIAS